MDRGLTAAFSMLFCMLAFELLARHYTRPRPYIQSISYLSFFCNRDKKSPPHLCPMNLAIRRSEAAEGRNRSSAVRVFASRPTA